MPIYSPTFVTSSGRLTFKTVPEYGDVHKLYWIVHSTASIYPNFLLSHGYVMNSGIAWSWGLNTNGQVGDNSMVIKQTPVTVCGNHTFCQISGGLSTSLGIDNIGKIWAWGLNGNGQIGDNTITSRITPVSIVGAAKTFCAISGNYTHSLGIDKNGIVWAWGNNGNGQLGDNSITSRRTPVAILGAVKTFCKISVGQAHSLAIDKNGQAWGWGNNGSGRVGDNSIVSKRTPVAICGAHTFCQISAGQTHSMGIDNNGKAWGWGPNGSGQIGDNTITGRLSPVSVYGAHTFCQINAGNLVSVAVDNNGKVWSWGSHVYDTLALEQLLVSTPVAVIGGHTFCQIATNQNQTTAIDKNNKVWGWGYKQYLGTGFSFYTPNVIITNSTFNYLAAGQVYSMAVDINGKAWAWGSPQFGELGNNSISGEKYSPIAVCGTHTFCQISSTYWHSLGVDNNGKAWSWGNNQYGQLGDNTIVSKRTPIAVLGAAKTFCQIAGSYSYSLGIDQNGQAWGWGYNQYGQLGDNTAVSKRTPVAVLGAAKTFCQISGGQYHSLAVDKNGQAWGWGQNNYGQLGDNTVVYQSTPVAVCGNHTFCQIYGSNNYTLAIDKNGQAWSWGYNQYGQLGDNTVVSKRTPIAVCGNHTFCRISSGLVHVIALDQNGKAWGWGQNVSGKIGDDTDIHKSTPVAVLGSHTFCSIIAGYDQSLGIDHAGQTWAWGNNTSYKLGLKRVTLTPTAIYI